MQIPEEYLNELKSEKRLLSTERDPENKIPEIAQQFKDINNGWAAAAFKQNPRDIQVIEPKQAPRPQPVPKYTESSPSPEEVKEELNGKILDERVKEFLDTKTDFDELETEPISQATNPIITFSYNYTKPAFEYAKPKGFITIKPTKIYIDSLEANSSIKVTGYFQLYDIAKPDFLSQPVYFKVEKSEIKFTQTNNDTVYLELQRLDPTIKLLTMINTINGNAETPYALSLSPLFDEHQNFVDFSFKKEFNYIDKPFITEALEDAIHKKNHETRTIGVTAEVNFVDKCNDDFSYLWDNQTEKPLLIPTFPAPLYSQIPLLTIHDVWATLDLSSGKAYYKAYICKEANFNSPVGEEVIIDKNKQGLVKEFVSQTFNANKINTFADFLTFIPFKGIEKSHVILKFYKVEDNGQRKIAGVSVLPLKVLHNGKSYVDYKLELFSDEAHVQKEATSKVIKPKKEGTGIKLSLKSPVLYFPPKEVSDAYLKNYDTPDLSNVKSLVLKYCVVPLFARVIKISDDTLIKKIVELLNLFDNDSTDFFRRWLFNFFDPIDTAEDFAHRYLELLTKQIQIYNNEENPAEELAKFIPQLRILLDIFLICYADGRSQIGSDEILLLNYVLGDLVLKALHCNADAATVNEQLSYFFFNNLYLFTPEEITKFVYKHLRRLSIERQKANDRDAISSLQFVFLSPLACSKHLLVVLGLNAKSLDISVPYSPFNPLTSQILLAVQQVFSGHDPDTFTLAVGFFARSISSVESDVAPEVKRKIAYALFPLIELLSNVYESPLFKSNRRMQQALVPFVLFLLSNSDRKMLVTFFHSLSLSFQQHFVSFLTVLAQTVIDTLDVVKPTYENPTININLLQLLTKHLFKFLIIIKDELKQCMTQVALLVRTLLSEYQPTENYGIIYSFCDQVCNIYPCEREFVKLFISLLRYQQHSARCLGTALCIMQFQADYHQFNQINISAISFSDAIATAVLESNVDKMPLYVLFANSIKDLSPSDPSKLNKLISERMDDALAIIEVVTKQKTSKLALSERNKQLMALADNNMKLPNMRLKWLNEMVRINQEAGDTISALICQLHCTALISTIYELRTKKANEAALAKTKGKQSLPKPPGLHLSTTQPIRTSNTVYDFGRSRTFQEFLFMPSVQIETKIDINQMKEDAEILLSDFNQPLLLQNLEKSIKLCEDAQLTYTLRCLSSMALRVLYQTRSYAESYDVCERLANYLSSITSGTAGVELPLQFFLIERRKDGKKDQRVYCCKKSEENRFLTQIRQREGIQVSRKICENHAECKGDGVCVIRLEPVIEKPKGNTDEARHCYDKFRSVVPIYAQIKKSLEDLKKPIQVLNIQTVTALPDYRQGIEIKKIEVEETDINTICDRTVEQAVNSLELIASDFDTYLEYASDQFKDSPSTLFGKDLPRFKETLHAVLRKQNSAADCILLFKDKKPEVAQEYAQKIAGPLFNVLRVYRRAAHEIEAELTDEAEKKVVSGLLAESTTMIKQFAEREKIEMIPDDDVYKGKSDPMKEFCPYESEYNE